MAEYPPKKRGGEGGLEWVEIEVGSLVGTRESIYVGLGGGDKEFVVVARNHVQCVKSELCNRIDWEVAFGIDNTNLHSKSTAVQTTPPQLNSAPVDPSETFPILRNPPCPPHQTRAQLKEN